MSNDNWEGEEVISVYDDCQAIEDGVIVDISELGLDFRGRPLNRITRGLWDDFQPFITFESTLPHLEKRSWGLCWHPMCLTIRW